MNLRDEWEEAGRQVWHSVQSGVIELACLTGSILWLIWQTVTYPWRQR